MKENLFEIDANFSDGWSSDNQEKSKKKISNEVKTSEKHLLNFTKENSLEFQGEVKENLKVQLEKLDFGLK